MTHLSVAGSPEDDEHKKGPQPASKKDKTKGAQKKKKKGRRSGEDSMEAGEDTDEGEMESREVDYMTDSSSESEQEFQVCTRLSRVMPLCHIL